MKLKSTVCGLQYIAYKLTNDKCSWRPTSAVQGKFLASITLSLPCCVLLSATERYFFWTLHIKCWIHLTQLLQGTQCFIWILWCLHGDLVVMWSVVGLCDQRKGWSSHVGIYLSVKKYYLYCKFWVIWKAEHFYRFHSHHTWNIFFYQLH